MIYTILSDNKLIFKESDLQKLKNTLPCLPQYSESDIVELQDSEIEQSNIDGTFYLTGYAPMKSEEEVAQEEATRIANLSMTRGDFFRGVFKATSIKREALRFMIESATLDGFTEDDRELALIDFDEGLNFNRGNELVELLCANSDITSAQMTAFFETGDYTELTKIEESEVGDD